MKRSSRGRQWHWDGCQEAGVDAQAPKMSARANVPLMLSAHALPSMLCCDFEPSPTLDAHVLIIHGIKITGNCADNRYIS